MNEHSKKCSNECSIFKWDAFWNGRDISEFNEAIAKAETLKEAMRNKDSNNTQKMFQIWARQS